MLLEVNITRSVAVAVSAKGNVTFCKWYLSSSVHCPRNVLTTSLKGVTSQKTRIFS